jgi:hypothetical protein
MILFRNWAVTPVKHSAWTRSWLVVMLVASLWAGVLTAQGTEREILGGHEGWLDRMGGGIRELGMGNTGTASEESNPAAYWNPAVLPFNRQTTVGMGADIRSLDRNGGYASLQGRVAGNMGMGIGILNRGDFNVQAYSADEKPIGIARPQALESYLGIGIKTARSNSFGLSVQGYSSDMDLGGSTGNVNIIGIFNLGWYKRWGNSLKTGVVVRNLGISKRLSAEFDQTTIVGEEASGFDHTATDFFPKTLVAAVFYTTKAGSKTVDLAFEVMDFQMKNEIYVSDANFHTQDIRLGVDVHWTEDMSLRAGIDRGNLSMGFGYILPWGKRKIMFDYALLVERGYLTVNPYAVGLRYAF